MDLPPDDLLYFAVIADRLRVGVRTIQNAVSLCGIEAWGGAASFAEVCAVMETFGGGNEHRLYQDDFGNPRRFPLPLNRGRVWRDGDDEDNPGFENVVRAIEDG